MIEAFVNGGEVATSGKERASIFSIIKGCEDLHSLSHSIFLSNTQSYPHLRADTVTTSLGLSAQHEEPPPIYAAVIAKKW